MKFSPQIVVSILLIILTGYEKVNSQDLSLKIQKGTIIIAVAGTDGILIAADSRITSAETKDGIQQVSYKDKCQKIFIVQGHPFANSGFYNTGAESFSDFIKEYNRTVTVNKNSFVDIIKSFGNYFVARHPYIASKNFLIIGGYKSDVAWFYYIKGQDAKGGPASMMVSDTVVQRYLDNYIPSYTGTLPCTKLANILEKAIHDCSEVRKTIGGPVSIVKINKDNSYSWFKNDFSGKPEGETKPHIVPVTDTAVWNAEIRMFMNLK